MLIHITAYLHIGRCTYPNPMDLWLGARLRIGMSSVRSPPSRILNMGTLAAISLCTPVDLAKSQKVRIHVFGAELTVCFDICVVVWEKQRRVAFCSSLCGDIGNPTGIPTLFSNESETFWFEMDLFHFKVV